MTKKKIHLYSLYGDRVEVTFSYDESLGRFLRNYPDFNRNQNRSLSLSHPRLAAYNPFLWFALMFVSGGTAFAASRKLKRLNK